MQQKTNRTIEKIEHKMESISPDPLRYEALNTAKNFKTSWIGLGQVLNTVWRDKSYKEWGYTEFESYVTKEIGIRKETALKLLRSYAFLENKEPHYLKKDHTQDTNAREVPTYEAVDVLRRASTNKNLDKEDYTKIKKYVLDDGKDVKGVKKDLSEIIKSREETDPEEAWQKKRISIVKRFLNLLKSIKIELKASKILPKDILNQTETLINKIENNL